MYHSHKKIHINYFITMSTGCLVYICDFHREQAWLWWVNNSKNGIPKESKESLLTSLRELAKAPTEDEFQSALPKLELIEIWSVNKKLQNWMSCTWLPQKKVSRLSTLFAPLFLKLVYQFN